MINFDDVIKENIKEHNPSWQEIPDHSYRILIFWGSGSGKTISLFNLISQQPDIDKMYLSAKDPYEAKYQFLINKRESTGLKHFNDWNKKRKILIVFDDMLADMLSNKILNPIVTELYIRGRKLNIYFVFITQSYFSVLTDITLNSRHYFVMKVSNKRELQQIAYNHSSDIDLKDFINLYKNVLQKHILF